MRIQSKIIGTTVLFLATAISLAAQQPLGTEYRIGPKDLLEVTAMGVPEINKFVVRVSEDGKITLPLLGEVDVNNLTRSEVEKKLVAILGEKYLVNPQISQAGGMTRDAGNEIIVIRQFADGTSTSIHISVDDLFFKGDAKLNIPLEPGDIVTIPVDKIVVIYVFGQVKNPGALQVKKSNIPTLLQAIAQAGGFSDRASRGNIKIRRKDAAGKDIEITVNAKDILKGKIKNDVPLLENDTVYVPESLF
jgi:polysaccharide export outer membrane protein